MSVEPWDFALLLDAPPPALFRELAATHTELANIYEEIAFNKVGETANPLMKTARLQLEGHRDALKEKKALLVRLLDAAAAG